MLNGAADDVRLNILTLRLLYFRKGLTLSIEGRRLVSTVKKTPALFEETLTSDMSESRERTMVNRSLSFIDHAGIRVVFRWYEPLYRFAIFDVLSVRFVAVHLRLSGLATQEKLSRAFGQRYCYQLAERRRVKVGRLRAKRKKDSRSLGPQFLWMREVRVLRADGRQTAILTTREDLATVEVPYRQFHRWRQENYFKYMAAEYELDGLVEYQVQDMPAAADRPNPARRPVERALASAQTRVQRLRAQVGEAVGQSQEKRQRTMRGFKIANAQLRAELADVEQDVSRLKAQLQDLPKRVSAEDLKTLTTEKKAIVDTIKMAAYQVETGLLVMLRDYYPRADDEGRTLLQAAFQSTGRIEITDDELFVELVSQSSPHRTEAFRDLCENLNAILANFPGSDLRLHLAVQPHEPITN